MRSVPQRLLCFIFLLSLSCKESSLPLKRLPENDINRVQAILQELDPLIKQKEQDKTMATLSFEEVYVRLDAKDREFLHQFQDLDPVKAGIKTQWHGIADGNVDLVQLDDQTITKSGKAEKLSPQFVSRKAFESYSRMMRAMKKDLGKSLLVESGYRSSAYQLYLFILYLKNHDYSILETAKWNALPGYSEHGDPNHQALDFMNEEGINGEDHPDDFAVLPEYKWLTEHAPKFGFFLSYPKNSEEGIAYEPWHWHYEENQDVKKQEAEK